MCTTEIGMRTMLSSGFEPPLNADLRFAMTPITVNRRPSILISLPKRVCVLKELVSSIAAKHGDEAAVLVFSVGEPPPLDDLQIVGLQRLGQIAIDDGVLGFARLVLHGERTGAELLQHDAEAGGRSLNML